MCMAILQTDVLLGIVIMALSLSVAHNFNKSFINWAFTKIIKKKNIYIEKRLVEQIVTTDQQEETFIY